MKTMKYSEKNKIEYEKTECGALNFFFDGEEYTLTVPFSLDNISEEERDEDALGKALNFLNLNKKEKNNHKKRFDKIQEQNYILIETDNLEDCFIKNIEYEDLEEAYEHSGMYSTYYIIKGNDETYLSFNPYFYNVCFESFCPEQNAVYFKNTGKECLFISIGDKKYLVRPDEQIKICEKNLYDGIDLFDGYGIKMKDWEAVQGR